MCDNDENTTNEIANSIGKQFALSIFRYLWLPEASRAAFVQAARDYMAGYPELERRAVEDAICAVQQANGEKVCAIKSGALANTVSMPDQLEDPNPFAPGTFAQDEIAA